MAFTVYQTNKKTGTVYAYSQENYRDPVTKRNKVRLTYLGRVDPVTKLIITKAESGKRNRSKPGSEAATILPDEAYGVFEELRKQVMALSEQVTALDREQKIMNQVLIRVKDAMVALDKPV